MDKLTIDFYTQDGRHVTLREPDDHILEVEIQGQVIAHFFQHSVSINAIIKEVEISAKEKYEHAIHPNTNIL